MLTYQYIAIILVELIIIIIIINVVFFHLFRRASICNLTMELHLARLRLGYKYLTQLVYNPSRHLPLFGYTE